MKFNELGTTGLKVSHVGLGGATFSNIYGTRFLNNCEQLIDGPLLSLGLSLFMKRPGAYPTTMLQCGLVEGLVANPFVRAFKKFDEAKGLELIKETMKHGVNYFETGPWYGQGSSERTMGKALKGLPRKSYVIASKVGRYEKDTAKMFDYSAEKTEAGVDNTLRLLGLDYVDIIQVHDVTFAPDTSVILKETLPVLEKAVRDGKARYIGIADYDLDLMKEIVEESEVKISSVLSYAKGTLIDNRLQNYAKYFKSKGVGVINAAATGMGLLSNQGPQPWHPASDDIKALCRRASDYCKTKNVELARIATWFTLNQPDIDTNICGFYNISQLLDTIDVLDRGITPHEKNVLRDVQMRFFDKLTLHWDDVELPAYKAKLSKC